MLSGFLRAAEHGDLAAFTRRLADDVTSWTDGGGAVRQARRPILGRTKVAAFWSGLLRKYPTGSGDVVESTASSVIGCRSAARSTC
jgi:RNA polymerase sigma-70 factor, ECF subfamily